MRLAAAYASVVLPTPGLPSSRGCMGRSCSFTTSHAASNWRMSSSWPTQRTGSSSGCARCRVTPSMSTVISGYIIVLFGAGLRIHLRRILFREERREQRYGCLPRALCQPDRAGLIARKRFGEVAGVTDVDPERRQPLRVGKPVRDGRFHAAEDVEEPLNIMRFSKLDLMTNQDRLHVLLDSLLTVERNDVPEPISLGSQARGDIRSEERRVGKGCFSR